MPLKKGVEVGNFDMNVIHMTVDDLHTAKIVCSLKKNFLQ